MKAATVEIPEGYKMTELGLSPEEWGVTRIGELFEIQQGKALSPKARLGKSPIPFLRTANVLWGYIDLTTLDMMDFSEQEVERLHLIPRDLLVCEGGDIGRTAMWHGEVTLCCYQNHIHRLRPKNHNVDPEFYMFWMQAAIKLLGLYCGEGNKTTIPNLSKARLSNFAVPFPPLPEQKKIAAVLSAVQEAKEKTETVIQAAKELKKSLMKHLFTYGPVSVQEAENVPLKETEVGVMPDNWDVVELRRVIEKPKQINPTKTPSWHFKYVDVSGISNEHMSIQNYSNYLGKNAPSRARKQVKIHDVIFATVRPYLRRVAIVPSELDGQICSTAFCIIRANAILADFKYLFYVVSSDGFVQRVSENQRGSSYPAVTDKDVLNQSIPLAALPIQRQISEVLSAIDKKIESEENRKKALDQLFRTLLHDLMTARIRVNRLEVEV